MRPATWSTPNAADCDDQEPTRCLLDDEGAEGVEWGEDYRGAARQALAELLEGRMGQLIDEHLKRMAELG